MNARSEALDEAVNAINEAATEAIKKANHARARLLENPDSVSLQETISHLNRRAHYFGRAARLVHKLKERGAA